MEQHMEKKSQPRIGVAVTAGFLLFIGSGAFLAACARLKPAPLHEGLSFSEAVYDRGGRLLKLTPTPDGRLRLWTPLREVSPLMIRATDLQEQDAPKTWGATPLATSLASMKYNLEGRSLRERARLSVMALKLQLAYSREDLLEGYLNLASYGGSIQGVGAASLIYFDKNADQLNLSEALRLSVIPRHPVRRILAGRANPQDQTARRLARRDLAARWQRPAAAPAPDVSERLEVLRRLVRQGGTGWLVSAVDRGLGRLSERQDQADLEARLDAGLRH